VTRGSFDWEKLEDQSSEMSFTFRDETSCLERTPKLGRERRF
jgi:hypothetical protein